MHEFILFSQDEAFVIQFQFSEVYYQCQAVSGYFQIIDRLCYMLFRDAGFAFYFKNDLIEYNKIRIEPVWKDHAFIIYDILLVSLIRYARTSKLNFQSVFVNYLKKASTKVIMNLHADADDLVSLVF